MRVINALIAANSMPVLPDTWQWVWMVGKGEYQGTFPKRVAKHYFKVHGLKLTAETISEIGNLAKRYSTDSDTYRFDFVDHINWQDGDFGDRGSCYWGSNAGAKLMIEENGGYAVRFFDSLGHGKARAWIVQVDHNWVLFNGYGMGSNSTLKIASILALYWELDFKEIDIRDTGTLYINGGRGYLIGKPEEIASIRYHRFDWDERDTCTNCGDPVYERYWGADEEIYCEDCYLRLFESCERCGEVFHRDSPDLEYYDDYGVLCEYCVERYFAECASCHEFGQIINFTKAGDHYYCSEHRPHDDD